MVIICLVSNFCTPHLETTVIALIDKWVSRRQGILPCLYMYLPLLSSFCCDAWDGGDFVWYNCDICMFMFMCMLYANKWNKEWGSRCVQFLIQIAHHKHGVFSKFNLFQSFQVDWCQVVDLHVVSKSFWKVELTFSSTQCLNGFCNPWCLQVQVWIWQ